MGLAPYGEPKYERLIRDNLIDIKPDGTFRLQMAYFDYATGLRMTNDRFADLFGRSPRKPDQPLAQQEMDIAASVQAVTEDVVLRIARTLHQETGSINLCLAGGVALNCVANGRLQRESPFENLWIQPAAGDAGGALGCALAAWHQYTEKPRRVNGRADQMQGAYLGPRFSENEVMTEMDQVGAVYERLEDELLFERLADFLNQGKIVGWFQGRMEFGPRALGGRSILGDPRNAEMQSVMNLKIKYRESFRPFAPAVLAECVSDYFDQKRESPYMLIVAEVKHCRRKSISAKDKNLFGIDQLKLIRSDIPAVTEWITHGS